jgi:hypothetical protein
MTRNLLNGFLLAVFFILSIASFVLGYMAANDEPYLGYRRSDVISQVAMASALITCWIFYLLAIATFIITRQISFWWLILMLWGVLCVFARSDCTIAYLDDLEQWVLHLKS